MSYPVEYTEISSTFMSSRRSAFYELRNGRDFVTFILDPSPRAAARVQFMSYILAEFTEISSTFMSSRRKEHFMSSELLFLILPYVLLLHVQFMSSEHADVYERGELDQDTGGDQDVDIR
jgi:hypothetical protein